MRHRKGIRKLGRHMDERRALLRGLSARLLEHESIVTTIPKAKEARRVVERLITLGKRGTLAARRLVASRLQDEALAKKLCEVIAPRYATRPGGYTRIVRLARRRVGDAAQLCLLELMDKVVKEKPKKEKK
jgi:large subunit ribosomal protein L17